MFCLSGVRKCGIHGDIDRYKSTLCVEKDAQSFHKATNQNLNTKDDPYVIISHKNIPAAAADDPSPHSFLIAMFASHYAFPV